MLKQDSQALKAKCHLQENGIILFVNIKVWISVRKENDSNLSLNLET